MRVCNTWLKGDPFLSNLFSLPAVLLSPRLWQVRHGQNAAQIFGCHCIDCAKSLQLANPKENQPETVLPSEEKKSHE
jgi:hypothetical protein